MVSRVELFALVRRDARVEGLSVRALAERHGVHRRTVRQALGSAVPPSRKTPARSSPVTGPLREAMDGMLRADLDAPRKQRHTAHRIWERLVDEHDATIAYRTVSTYVAKRCPEIVLEARNRASVMDGFVPQRHLPGQDAEVGFAEVWVNVGGVDTRCFLFTLRMSFSGKAIHRVCSSQGQEAFFAGHVAAFTELGGVPAGEIRYDNLSSAVRRVCFGRSRLETDRWVLFKSAYGITSFYCMPGKEGAHEKGGAEGEGDQTGTRLPIEVLLLHRRMRHAHVIAGIRVALEAGSVSPDVVAIEARKHAAAAGEPSATEEPLQPRRSRSKVVSLPERRRDPDLPADSRPAPSVAAYDQLLRNTPRKGNAS